MRCEDLSEPELLVWKAFPKGECPLFSRDGFTSRGEVVLRRARISSFLDLEGARLSNPDSYALFAPGIAVDGGVSLRDARSSKAWSQSGRPDHQRAGRDRRAVAEQSRRTELCSSGGRSAGNAADTSGRDGESQPCRDRCTAPHLALTAFQNALTGARRRGCLLCLAPGPQLGAGLRHPARPASLPSSSSPGCAERPGAGRSTRLTPHAPTQHGYAIRTADKCTFSEISTAEPACAQASRPQRGGWR